MTGRSAASSSSAASRTSAGSPVGHRVVAGEVEVARGRASTTPSWLLAMSLGMSMRTGPGSAGGGHVEGLGHHPGDVVHVGDQPVVLGDAHGDAGDVALLEGVGADGGGGHLAGDHDQGDRVHEGVGQGGDDVGGARARGDHGHAGPAGDLGVALGHVAGALLVADQDVADRRVDDGVVDGQDGAAGEAEHDLHLLHLEALDEGLGSGEFHRVLPCRRWSVWWSGRSVGRIRPGDPWADMKTTSRLGGRKAHTAKGRRVRYETSTRMLWWTGLLRHGGDIVAQPGWADKGVRTRRVTGGNGGTAAKPGQDGGMRRLVLTVTCPDGTGIVAAVTGFIASHGGWVVEAAQHGDLDTGRFFQRIEVLADSLPFGPEEFGQPFRRRGRPVPSGLAPA